MHRIELGTASYNERAQRLYERFGFKKEGVRREYVFMGRKWWDIVDYGSGRSLGGGGEGDGTFRNGAQPGIQGASWLWARDRAIGCLGGRDKCANSL